MENESLEHLSRDELVARLRAAEATVATLQGERTDTTFVDQLRAILADLATTGHLAAPASRTGLLELIVGTAAQVLAARAAVLYLRDHEANTLTFTVAVGKAHELAGLLPQTFPMGIGIAGWVAATGQPVARSDVASDPRFPLALAQELGYVPQTTMCLPLRSADEVIGVIQLFDKNGGEPFTPGDMELFEQFAAAAAVALEQSQLLGDLRELFVVLLRRARDGSGGEQQLEETLRAQAAGFAARTVQGARYRDALEIAALVGEIGGHGPAASQHARQVLASLVEYLRAESSRATTRGWLT